MSAALCLATNTREHIKSTIKIVLNNISIRSRYFIAALNTYACSRDSVYLQIVQLLSFCA